MKKFLTARRTMAPLVATVLLCAIQVVSAATAPLYRVVDLGTLGGSFSVPYGINDNGTVVGASSDNTGVSYPFYFDTSMHRIGIPSGNTNASARGINASGQVVGFSDTILWGYYISSVPFLYSPANGGSSVDMGFATGSGTRPFAINAYGSVVGYTTQNDGQWRAFLWRPEQLLGSTGTLHILGVLPGGRDSTAQDVNAYGTVVGTSYGADGLIHALKWTPDTSNGVAFAQRDLGVIPGCYGSAATAVNDEGQAVGWAYTGPDSSSPRRAVRYADTGVEELGSLGYANSAATDIGIDGTIVGNLTNSIGSVSRGFVFTSGRMYELTAQLDCFSTGWTITAAAGINSSGVIACRAVNSSGQTRAVKLVPVPDYPVPSITGVTPDALEKDSPGQTLTIQGTGFLPCSMVKWDSASLEVEFVSETTLRATVDAALLQTSGPHSVTVTNPAPGGGVSNISTVIVSVENQAPVMVAVALSTTLVAGGDRLQVKVTATDDSGIVSVTANGEALVDQGAYWLGYVTAEAAIGLHTVQVVISDAESLQTTDSSASYRTLPVVALNVKSMADPIMEAASQNFLFTVFGTVSEADNLSFAVSEGHGQAVRVEAPGHLLSNEQFVRVRGQLRFDITGSPYLRVHDNSTDIRCLDGMQQVWSLQKQH